MRRPNIIRFSAVLAALCLMGGCKSTTEHETTIIEPEIIELEIDYTDDDGTVFYKNPTIWTYEMIYDTLTIESRKVETPLTLEDFGEKYTIYEETLNYYEESQTISAGLVYNENKNVSVILNNCSDAKDRTNKEISFICLMNVSDESENLPDIKINGIGLNSTRDEIISALGVPHREIYDCGKPFSLSYKAFGETDSDYSIVLCLNEEKADTIYIILDN